MKLGYIFTYYLLLSIFEPTRSACSYLCLTCTSIPSQCTSCVTNCYVSVSKTCEANPGFFRSLNLDSLPYTMTCDDCDFYCKTCSSSSTTCTSCKPEQSRFLYNNECLTDCPATPLLFADPSSYECKLECPAPTWGDSSTRKCLSDCPTGQGGNTYNLRICENCHFTCKKCLDGGEDNKCIECFSGRYLENGYCVLSCNAGNYPDSSDNKCKTCHADCASCIAGSQNDCTNCKVTTNILYTGACYPCTSTQYLNPSDTLCYTLCPSGKYNDNSDRFCKNCISPCSTCFGVASTQCTSCVSGIGYFYFINNNECTAECPSSPSTFADDLTGNCEITCTGVQWGRVDVRKCDSSCPAGYWGNILNNRICDACHVSCFKCISGNNANQCSECSNSLYLENGFCKSSCSADKYKRISDWTCQPCNAYCLTCDGPNNNDCLSCSTGVLYNKICYLSCPTLLDPSQGCVEQCPNGKYPDYTDKICKNCPETCARCAYPGNNACITCIFGYFLQAGNCGTVCVGPTFKDLATQECKHCQAPCNYCLSNLQCKSCVPGYFWDKSTNLCYTKCLEPKVGNLETLSCEAKCDKGYFIYRPAQICAKCLANCLECENEENRCVSCKTGLFLFQSICIRNCPIGYFENKETNRCDDCPENCSNCTTPLFCQTCQSGYYLLTTNYKCTLCNDPGMIKRETFISCTYCVANCQNCSGLFTCSQCLPNYILASERECLAVKFIEPIFKVFDRVDQFLLTFNSSWDELIINLTRYSKEYAKLTIAGLSEEEFSYKMTRSILMANSIIIEVNTQKKILANTAVFLTIPQFLWLSQGSKVLTKYTFSSTFKADLPDCPSGEITNTEGRCISLSIVNPSLEASKIDPGLVFLRFDKDYPLLFSLVPSITVIGIAGLNSSNYNYSITQSKENQLIFKIEINYAGPTSNFPEIMLTMNLPGEIASNPSTRLSANTLRDRLRNNNVLDAQTSSKIESAKAADSGGANFVQTALNALSFLSGNSKSFSYVLIMELIKFLRFINVDYPPNALATLEAEFSGLNIFQPFLEIDLVDLETTGTDGKFDAYHVKGSLIYNKISVIFQIILFFSVGVFMNWVRVRRSFVLKNKFLGLGFYLVQRTFVWNYFFSLALSNFFSLMTYTLISLRWSSVKNNSGRLNLAVTIFTLLYSLLVIGLACYNISLVRKAYNYKTPESIPFLPPIYMELLNMKNQQTQHPVTMNDNGRINSLKTKLDSPPSGRLSAHLNERNYGTDEIFSPKEETHTREVTFGQVEIVKGQDDVIKTLKPSASNTEEEQNEEVDSSKSPSPKTFKARDWESRQEVIPVVRSRRLASNNKKPTLMKRLSQAIFRNRHVSTFFNNSQDEARKYSFTVLYKDFKLETSLAAYYPIANMIRYAVTSFALVFLFQFPLEQSASILLINVFMIPLTLFLSPFASGKDLIQTLVNESCLTIACLCTFLLGILDEGENKDQELRLNVGWMIVYANLILIYFFIFMFVFEWGRILKLNFPKFLNFLKAKLKSNKISRNLTPETKPSLARRSYTGKSIEKLEQGVDSN